MRRIGPADAVILADGHGRIVVGKNVDRPLVPASILKLFTSLFAMETLGIDHRFKTQFFTDEQRNLTIKGYGDPLLVSEVVAGISRQLAGSLPGDKALNDLRLDESYFARPLTIPGVSASLQPYDAPSGALCVNFNTVNFRQSGGRYASAEPQTPLLPFAAAIIKRNRATGGRVVLSQIKSENTVYAGMLFRHFLEKNGVRFDGSVGIGQVKAGDRLILDFRSPYTLPEIVARMLEYSNNFIANQLLISAGINRFGPPGSLDKGVRAARRYASARLAIGRLQISEGSGLSRKNRVSANQMLKVLDRFSPHHRLMRRDGSEYYKTGTLRGVSTRAGYLIDSAGRLCPFVIMFNTAGKSAGTLIPYLKRLIP